MASNLQLALYAPHGTASGLNKVGKFSPLSAVKNRLVIDPNGEHVGRIHDVLLDLNDGRIEYICIALRNGEGTGVAEAVVPWSSLTVDPAPDAVWVVAAGKSVLRAIARPVASRS